MTGLLAGIAGAAAPAQASSGNTIEHWGAVGTNGGQRQDESLTPVGLTLPAPVAQVSSSNSTEYALLTNGTVYAWGLGTDGQLGDGGTANSFTTAVQVQFPARVTIAFLPTDVMPYDSAFAVDTTGHVWGWGLDQGGEFCLGNTAEHTTPVELPLSGVTTLAGAADHASYDAGGTIYSCGTNQYGELGNGTTTSSTVPVKVTGLAGQPVASLVASFGDTGALLADGDYVDWGYDGAGQLGNGTTGQSSDVPVQVTLPGPVTQAAQGGSASSNGQTLVMLADGSLFAWGNGSAYQLGDGSTANEQSPVHIVPPAGVTYQALASGGNTSYAISTAGTVYAWGGNAVGQVGDGTTTPARKPVMVESRATLISSTSTDVVVSTAGPAAAGVRGTIEHWGSFIGDGSQHDESLSPVALTLPAPVKEVSSSNDAQYALLTNGAVYAWGQGGDGELGDGGTADSFTTPVQVQFPARVKIAFLPVDVMPFDSAFAVDTTGHAWGWGLNQGGEFCTGSATEYSTPVELPLASVTLLAGAADHATYDSGGTIYSCGTNQYGELGNGTTTSSKSPVKVAGLDGASVTALVASFGDTGALLTGGAYYDWGENNNGQVGNGATGTNADAPVQLTLPAPVAQASQGGSLSANGQTLVILTSGALYAWGSNTTYQLGDGTDINRATPEQIFPPAGVTYKTLATGGNTSYAITTTGAVYAWGSSMEGQVGDGTRDTAKKPVNVASGAVTISSTSTDVVVSRG